MPNMRVLHNRPNIGLGASYQRGVAEARHDYVMMLCGDGGLPASSLPPIIEKIGRRYCRSLYDQSKNHKNADAIFYLPVLYAPAQFLVRT
jgi:glycosyltransferase involved in cell wall biosynthesis